MKSFAISKKYDISGREEQAANQVRNQRAGRRKHKSVNYVSRVIFHILSIL
jgi:hypothetical protein